MVPPGTHPAVDLSTQSIHQSRASIHDFADLCAPGVDNLWKTQVKVLSAGPTVQSEPSPAQSAIGRPAVSRAVE